MIKIKFKMNDTIYQVPYLTDSAVHAIKLWLQDHKNAMLISIENY